MNTGFLSNPAPDSGFNAILGALAPQAAPAEGSLAGTSPSVHNRVKQTFINPVATYPFIARRWRNNWEQSFHPGDLMFVFTGASGAVSSRSVVMANLQLLNHIMATEGGGDAMPAEYKNPRRWNYVGVMRNSAVASDRQPQALQAARGSNRFPAERIINVDVRGSTRVFNYWSNATAGAHLWLRWVQVDGSVYALPFSANSTHSVKRHLDEAAETDKNQTGRYWQLVPWSSHGHEPPLHAWTNEQRLTGYGMFRAVRVGYVFQTVGQGEQVTHNAAIKKATQMSCERFKLPVISAFVRV